MKEFTITFEKDVKAISMIGDITVIQKGQKKTVPEYIMDKIIAGETITSDKLIGHGMTTIFSFSKKDLEVEFVETEVIVNQKIRRLRK